MTSLALLSIALLVNTLLPGREGRWLICLAALIPAGLHFVIADGLTDYEYYGTAACASLAVFAVLEYLPRSPLGVFIQITQVLAIAVHFIGYVMWYTYQEPLVYNVLVMGLIITEWFRLMVRTRADGEHWASNFMRGIRGNAHSSNSGVFK